MIKTLFREAENLTYDKLGKVAEWSNAPVLKTGGRLFGPGVQIPPFPLNNLILKTRER